ncbi:NAD-dependent epimerase/dehydratase family protein [Hymenobacter latericus]|uniref:NAD-dependent epimerase/dehydratase family protein n=1 Tax=Hymenobacter sp. YIM 151858-1 TaxID=2987688 RepID=UPI0022265921|nr:NAD-dependent epimerase/dehydratase family protein [Hymenobacter sp. YIM 151858-1]UYZ59460.1 NAD-dependent epimerase/dehydratase family protein [Hymenobacter sp. YIM 151858-1]
MKVIITGATGMVGEGVLHECLRDAAVEQVLVVTRRPTHVQHPKLREVLLANFADPAPVEDELTGYDACFFCLGVSSVGMSEAEYTRLTYDLTLGFARTLARLNPPMTFCYVSGAGTDGSERGRQMWARVKGRTENALQQLPFRRVYAFRPGYMHPTPGLKNTLSGYRYFAWAYPALRKLLPGYVSTLQEMAQAMINAARFGYPKPVLEVRDIVRLAHQQAAPRA